MQRIVTQVQRLRTFESFLRSRASWVLIAAMVWLMMPCGKHAVSAEPASRPNIVILFADDLVKTAAGEQPFELYHLGQDLRESEDLSDVQPKRFLRMKASWEKLVSQMPGD